MLDLYFKILICLSIRPTFPDFQGFVALENPIYVSFSLVFALLSNLQGKVFVIQF